MPDSLWHFIVPIIMMVQLYFPADTKTARYFSPLLKYIFSELIHQSDSKTSFKTLVCMSQVYPFYLILTVFSIPLFNTQIHMIQRSYHTQKRKSVSSFCFKDASLQEIKHFMENLCYICYKFIARYMPNITELQKPLQMFNLLM